MNGLLCLLYMSTASREMSLEEIDTLLRRARARNQARGITGALLHYGGRFVQVLEGESDVVEQCFARISVDPRHHAVTRLYSGPVEGPSFPDWSMRYLCSAGQPDRAVAEFLDQLQQQPSPDAVRQTIVLLGRLTAGSGAWQAR